MHCQNCGGFSANANYCYTCRIKTGAESISLNSLIANANNGDKYANTALGQAYSFGEFGVQIDKETGLRYFYKGAELGDANAQFHIGILYFTGKGVAKNERIAHDYFFRAACQGYREAQYWCGDSYKEGWGGVRNLKKAAEYFESAARQGHVVAQYRLGELYVAFLREETSSEKLRHQYLIGGLDWLCRAFLNGSEEARGYLIKIGDNHPYLVDYIKASINAEKAKR